MTTGESSAITIDDALKMFAEVFEDSEENVKADTEREAIEGWDSLGALTLMAELDERFEITLSEEELEDLSNISDLLDILRKNGVLQE